MSVVTVVLRCVFVAYPDLQSTPEDFHAPAADYDRSK
jgi:hypothetical protein